MLQTVSAGVDVRGAEKSQLPLEKNQVNDSLLERPDKPFMLEDLSNISAIPIEL